MKIYILDKFKITKFDLPKKIEDSYLIPYTCCNNIQENVITVEAYNNRWQLRSNGSVNILNGKSFVDSVILENYGCYLLKVLGQEEYIFLFALPDRELICNLKVKDMTSILIGSSDNCNIVYKNNLTNEIHAEIKLINDEWYIASCVDKKFMTYVNSEKVSTKKLNIGDVIFINGLRIIWMKEFIKISNPKNTVKIKGMSLYKELDELDNSKYSPVDDENANVDLYNEDDYFYHRPRLVPTIEKEDINIDAPPGEDKITQLPWYLTLGMSFMLFASSGIMIYNIVYGIIRGREIASLIPQIVMCSAMLIGGLIMPRILKAYEKKRKKKREQERQTKYKAYLDKMNTKIQYALKKQLQILKENNLTSKECYDIIINKSRKLWLRQLSDEDFLKIRLGSGDINSFVRVTAPQEHFTLDVDNLIEEVYKVDNASKKLINAPITLDISSKTVMSFIFECTYKDKYVDSILTQILALHSSDDLKIVLFTNKQNEKRWEFLKFIPHCFSEDKEKRFFATDPEEYKNISSYLEEQFKIRREIIIQQRDQEGVEDQSNYERKYKKFRTAPPYYLIITDDYKAIKNIPIISNIQKSNINYGFSFITISNNMKNLPNKCEKYIQIGEKESCILEKKLSDESQIVFTNEYEETIDMNRISLKLSNIPVLTKDAISELPTHISFLEMYGVSKIEQLNSFNRWHTNDPVSSLSVPIGVHTDGTLFKLDLHEKYHGPHGLIAGMTGSGKSEFIITFILSMCVNYHPYEVQFVLIDYKGGGLAGAFENKETGVKVPHLVGTITNLDTAQMNRTLVSISSELKKRQKKFNEVKDKLGESTIDIYKYQKFYREGLIDEPMAHLFIISDEFAELKSQRAEFLQELVSTARIGRSLGVHLILATQKPSGVVNDQIWSNSKFKVCLKVQDRSDSMEMLKKPDAALIKETGRFYLQVGYDDYFDVGQAGWGGAKYIPTDRIIKKTDDSINYINNTGDIVKSINEVIKTEVVKDYGDQLTNIVKYIHNLSEKENIMPKTMWLDPIPEKIYIDDLKAKYNYKPTSYLINPVIGEYDNPSSQLQGILNINLSKNTLIYGQGGSGKDNLLSTLLWSTIVEHTPEEVNFYVIDCGAETLKKFYKFPHVGEISLTEERDKIIDTFNMLAKELEDRKERYVDYSGNYQDYCQNSGKKDPLLVTIINSYENFVETHSKLSEHIQTLYRDGAKYGITFVVSCITVGAIRGKVAQSFSQRMTLQLPKNEDYRAVLNAPKGLIPSKYFGRGLIEKDDTSYEFQTAYISAPKNVSNIIRYAAENLSNAYKVKAKKVPTVPKVVTLDSFAEEKIELNSLPIGCAIMSKEIFKYDFTKYTFNNIVSADMQNRLNFSKAIIKMLNKIENINIKIIDFVEVFKDSFKDIPVFSSNFNEVIQSINEEIKKEKESNQLNYYIFVGIGEFESELTKENQQLLSNIFTASSTYQNTKFIFVDNYSSYKKLQVVDWFRSQIDKSHGIWLGPEISNQMAFNVSNLDMNIRSLNFPNMGFVIEKNNFTIIKYVVDGDDNNEK